MKHRISIVAWLFFTWLIWGPIVINSQPGTSWVLFGIDWKADNLDNTMFWWGIILSILNAASLSYEEREEKKERARYNQRYDIK